MEESKNEIIQGGAEMTEQTKSILPCPFCGSIPKVNLGKTSHCSLHGDPFQSVRVYCDNNQCFANPRVEGGDVHNGGEPKARLEAIERWNVRKSEATQ